MIAIIGGHNRCVDYLATLLYPYHKDIHDLTPLDYVIDNDEDTITDIPTANAIAKFLCESNREIYYGDAMKEQFSVDIFNFINALLSKEAQSLLLFDETDKTDGKK